MLAQMTQQAQPQVTLWMILLSAALTDNILLTRFLGMCPFLSISRELKSAFGLGLAVVFTTACTCGLNAALYWYVLIPLERRFGLPAESLKLILFIVVIAAFVQLMEMLIERLSLGLYFALGIFLPLITVNCAILGAALFMINKSFRVIDGLMFGLGSGAGWMLAIVMLAGIRVKLAKTGRVPAALEGPGITLIITGLMALAFIGFSGMIQ